MKNTERLALLFGLGNLLTAASQLRALVGPATILTGFPAGGQPPAAPSRAKHQGLNAGQQRPDRSSHSLHRSVKYNLHQGDPIQSILKLGILRGAKLGSRSPSVATAAMITVGFVLQAVIMAVSLRFLG